MPTITKSYCDICGKESDITEQKILAGYATKKSVEHTIKVNLEVSRRGPVNSVSEPVGDMDDDRICIVCYHSILTEFLNSKLPKKHD
jgi:hypothetical protein